MQLESVMTSNVMCSIHYSRRRKPEQGTATAKAGDSAGAQVWINNRSWLVSLEREFVKHRFGLLIACTRAGSIADKQSTGARRGHRRIGWHSPCIGLNPASTVRRRNGSAVPARSRASAFDFFQIQSTMNRPYQLLSVPRPWQVRSPNLIIWWLGKHVDQTYIFTVAHCNQPLTRATNISWLRTH
jgi:hypothetical protein